MSFGDCGRGGGGYVPSAGHDKLMHTLNIRQSLFSQKPPVSRKKIPVAAHQVKREKDGRTSSSR